MGHGAEGQGLPGGRYFPFWGLLRDESSKPSTLMNCSSDTAGERREGVGSQCLVRDLVFNFALLQKDSGGNQ